MPGGSLDFTEPCMYACYITLAALTQIDIHDEDRHTHVNAWTVINHTSYITQVTDLQGQGRILDDLANEQQSQ